MYKFQLSIVQGKTSNPKVKSIGVFQSRAGAIYEVLKSGYLWLPWMMLLLFIVFNAVSAMHIFVRTKHLFLKYFLFFLNIFFLFLDSFIVCTQTQRTNRKICYGAFVVSALPCYTDSCKKSTQFYFILISILEKQVIQKRPRSWIGYNVG